jgi:hypothetical protein
MDHLARSVKSHGMRVTGARIVQVFVLPKEPRLDQAERRPISSNHSSAKCKMVWKS